MFTVLKSVEAFKKAAKRNIIIPAAEHGDESSLGQRFDEGNYAQEITMSHLSHINDKAIAVANCKAVVKKTLSKIDRVKRFTRTITMRLLLIAYTILIVYFMACVNKDETKWFLMIPVFFIVLDTLYICIVRKGTEFDW